MDQVIPGDNNTSGRRLDVLLLMVAGILWGVLLFYIALEPRPPRIPGISGSTTAAAGHFVTHAILTGWLFLLFYGVLKRSQRVSVLLAVLSAIAIGVGLEVAQDIFSDSRAFQRADIASNLSGALVAALALVLSLLGKSPFRHIAIAVVVAATVFAAGTLALTAVWNPDFPYAGDHWHVQYVVIICGEPQRAFAPFPGDIHSHGDQLIHLHPNSDETSGANANLGRFFELAGGELTNTSLSIPDGPTYNDGDICDDGNPGRLTLDRFEVTTREREERIDSPATYVPRNSETLIIEFGSEPYDLSFTR